MLQALACGSGINSCSVHAVTCERPGKGLHVQQNGTEGIDFVQYLKYVYTKPIGDRFVYVVLICNFFYPDAATFFCLYNNHTPSMSHFLDLLMLCHI